MPRWNKPTPPLYAPAACDAAFPRSPPWPAFKVAAYSRQPSEFLARCLLKKPPDTARVIRPLSPIQTGLSARFTACISLPIRTTAILRAPPAIFTAIRRGMPGVGQSSSFPEYREGNAEMHLVESFSFVRFYTAEKLGLSRFLACTV